MINLLLSLASVAALPLLALFIFRASSAVVFFAACVGVVLLSGLDPAVVSTSGAIIPGDGESYIRFAVVFLTVVLAALFFRRTIRQPIELVLHSFITALTIMMLWVVLPALTAAPWLTQVTTDSTWRLIHDYETLIVAIGFCLSLIVSMRKKT